MKLYRSLMFRELKLTRKRCFLMLILFLLLALLMMLPIFLGSFSLHSEDETEAFDVIALFMMIFALIGGLLAGTNLGIQKSDISAGWKRYSFVLPPTAKQQALADLLVKLCYILLFGLLSAGFALIYLIAADYNCLDIMLNVYLAVVCVVMLIDVAYSYIIMFAKTKNELKILGVVAFLGAGLILKVLEIFTGDVNAPEQSGSGGALISDKAFNSFMSRLGSGKMILCVLAVFAVICALYFLVMWRSHERREP